MDLKNWRLNISRVGAMHFSKFLIIPVNVANDMNLEVGDYVRMEYDDKTKELKVKKN